MDGYIYLAFGDRDFSRSFWMDFCTKEKFLAKYLLLVIPAVTGGVITRDIMVTQTEIGAYEFVADPLNPQSQMENNIFFNWHH